MAIQERISLRGVHRAIAAVVRQLKRARRHVQPAERGKLEHVTREMQNLEARTTAMCGRVYGVWPPPPAKRGPTPPAPKPPAKPAPKPKKGRRKPPRPKKGR
jgi:hypothetical protein